MNDPVSTDLGPSPTDDVDPTGPPVWSPAEHSRIRFRLLAEFDATVEYLNRLLTADLTTADVADDIREALFTGRRKTARLTSLILDEFRWLVEHETADGHADPHDFCGDLATLTPEPVAEPVKSPDLASVQVVKKVIIGCARCATAVDLPPGTFITEGLALTPTIEGQVWGVEMRVRCPAGHVIP